MSAICPQILRKERCGVFDSVFNAMITQSLRRFNLCTIKKPDESRAFLQNGAQKHASISVSISRTFCADICPPTLREKRNQKLRKIRRNRHHRQPYPRRRLRGDVPYQRKLSQRRAEQSCALAGKKQNRLLFVAFRRVLCFQNKAPYV